MKTAAQTISRNERHAFGPALSRAVVVNPVGGISVCAMGGVMQRHTSHISRVSRSIRVTWKRGNSIRGERPLVANG